MADRDTLAILAEEFARLFDPLVAAFQSDRAYLDFLRQLGWTFTTIPPELTALKTPLTGALALVQDGPVDPSQVEQLLGLVLDAYKAIADIGSSTTLPADFVGEFPSQLVQFLLVEYLLDAHPKIGFLLLAIGLMSLEDVPPIGVPPPVNGRPAFVRRAFAFSEFGDVLSDPLTFFKGAYQWGASEFAGELFAANVSGLLDAWGFDVQQQRLDPETLSQLKANASSPDTAIDLSPRIVFIEHATDPEQFQAGVGLFILPETAADSPGFALLPFATADFSDAVDLTDNLTLTLTAGVDLTGDVGIFVRPDKNVQFLGGLDSGTPSPITGVLSAVLALGQPGDPIMLLGSPEASRVEVGGVSTTAGIRLLTESEFEVFCEFALQAAKIVVKPGTGDGDSFLDSLLPADGFELDFNLLLGFSTKKGLYFGGSGKFEASIPAHVTIGPLQILGASVALRPQSGTIEVDAAATFSADLSVLEVTVQNVGVSGEFTFPADGRGNLGPANLKVGFKPPDGIGIAVDAGSVHGGGFISIDPPNNRYFGGLQLSVYDIAVSAFALIETPNSGYSFVIIISAQFTPIQLGFGFTLNGVGGMVGINRAIDTTALANLVRAGQSEELLFPKNVVADAPTIVRDLTSVFPATQGHYVFGPLGKLGWGTPTLITGEIGVILEFPGPVVVLLGEVKCLLPKPDAALVKLNLSIDGELDFPNKTFAMDASLHDSVINGFPVSGQMAMRVTWGDQPNFVFSIGGFHPAYTPPPNFPKLQPMTLDLGSHGAAKISVSGFFAVTSNTVQVGGTATLHAGGSGITLDASVSVKALLIFQPFSFEADIAASVKVSFHGYGIGVNLSGTLDGPSPWHIKGEVCVSVLWWDACLGFDVTFGGDQQITQPALDPWKGADATDSSPAIIGLQQALSDPGNWSGALVPGTVSSVARAQGTDTLIDPVGGLTVRQKTAPVETPNPLTKFGVAKTTAPISFSTVHATLGTVGNTVALTLAEAVNDFFAPAQFFDMDDGKKLSSPAFEQHQAGYLFATATGNAQGGSTAPKTLLVHTVVINSDGSETPAGDYTPTSPVSNAAGARSAVAKGGLTQAGTRRFVDRAFTQPFTETVQTFVIASNTAMTQVTSGAGQVRSAVLIALDAFRAQHVELAAGVQVAASHEVVG